MHVILQMVKFQLTPTAFSKTRKKKKIREYSLYNSMKNGIYRYLMLAILNFRITKTQGLYVQFSPSVVIQIMSRTLYPINQWKNTTTKPPLTGCVNGHVCGIGTSQAPKKT